MPFARALCSDELFEQLRLPPVLRGDERLDPVGRELIFDLATCSVLIPHPFHYSDYPDRQMSFYVQGKLYRAWEYVARSDGPDRVDVMFAGNVEEADCMRIAELLEKAMAVLRNEAVCSVPVISRRGLE